MDKIVPNIDYDETNPISIEAYAKRLIGKTFRDVIQDNEKSDNNGSKYGISDVTETKRNKGNLGQIIEECFFHYDCNNDARPDFEKAGVELKVTPYKQNKDKSFSAKERLILTMIDYFSVVNEEFETSHFWKKARLILLV